MAHLLADTCRLINQILINIIRSITSCIDTRKPLGSPTLSAQEGELDNLLQEPSGGWDDQPQSRGYNKKAEMHLTSGVSEEAGRKLAATRLQPTWTEGRTMEELEMEEAELARFDRPGPPRDVDEFGDFEQAPGTGPL